MLVDIDYVKFQREMNTSLRQIFCESLNSDVYDNTTDNEEEIKQKDELYKKIQRILAC